VPAQATEQLALTIPAVGGVVELLLFVVVVVVVVGCCYVVVVVVEGEAQRERG
jgi:hypothetical protein